MINSVLGLRGYPKLNLFGYHDINCVSSQTGASPFKELRYCWGEGDGAAVWFFSAKLEKKLGFIDKNKKN